MHVESFYDPETHTMTHVVADMASKQCAVIDSVLNYDQDAARTSTVSLDKVIDYIHRHELNNQWILETHIHADHISGAFYLKKHIGGKTAIGSGIKDVLALWVPLFENDQDTPVTGEQFDHLFADNDTFEIGELKARVMHTPGHTPACSAYHIEDAVFVGDTLFAPNLGTARVDFPGGNAEDLYQSIQKIYTLADDTRMFLCHDYPQAGQPPMIQTTVGQQKSQNRMLNQQTTLQDYVKARKTRDKSLNIPRLILPSIQANMRLGDLGQPSDNGIRYLKIPVDVI